MDRHEDYFMSSNISEISLTCTAIDHSYKHKIKVQTEKVTVLTTFLQTYVFLCDKEPKKCDPSRTSRLTISGGDSGR